MKLLEYQAKEVFKNFKIPVPRGVVATSPQEAGIVAKSLGGPVVVKAQLSIGGRGKAGGILFADSPEDTVKATRNLVGCRIKGLEVKKVLVEEKLRIRDELYLAVVVDRAYRSYVVLASAEGGVDIEEVASKSPEKILKLPVDPLQGLRSYHALRVAKKMGFSGRNLREFATILLNLYHLAVEMDAELTEINPLVLTADGFIAADARLNIDNNSLFRHPKIQDTYRENEVSELTSRERTAKELGLNYVELDGNIGVIGNGAGLTMATLDTVMMEGGRPGNFLDLGGGAPLDRIEAAVKFLISDPKFDALFVNVIGGMTRCDDMARGIINAREKTSSQKPIVVRMMGINEEEGRILLEEAGIDNLQSMEQAAKRVVKVTGRS